MTGDEIEILIRRIECLAKESQERLFGIRSREAEIEQLRHELAAESAKKPGPVEGTWAWACEYVVKNRNKAVTRGGGESILAMYMNEGGCLKNTPLCNFQATIDDILSTDWRVVES